MKIYLLSVFFLPFFNPCELCRRHHLTFFRDERNYFEIHIFYLHFVGKCPEAIQLFCNFKCGSWIFNCGGCLTFKKLFEKSPFSPVDNREGRE